MTPPLLKGGQGRDPGSLERDASGVGFSLLLLLAVAGMIAARCVS